MIIPVKCFTCGMVIANKYRHYQMEVRKRKCAQKACAGDKIGNIDKVLYLTKEFHDKTPEGEVLDELKIVKMCCRRHFLTHVDIE
jgi:DNA-directed RNA polymerase subunit N (RpoN/RPB10)